MENGQNIQHYQYYYVNNDSFVFYCFFNKILLITKSVQVTNILPQKKISYRVCQKKKDILNIHIKSEGINVFSQKFF